MIIIRHIKDGDLSYVSHKDTQKVLQRGLNRAKVDVKFSQGFIPHMLTYASTPLPLGIQSQADYFGVECDGISAEQFLEIYNQSIPTGLRACQAWECAKNPNVAYNVIASDYIMQASNAIPKEFFEILDTKFYEVEIAKKGEITIKDIRPMIFDIQVEKSTIKVRIATGNTNLRIDNLVNHFNKQFLLGISLGSVVRIAQLGQKDGKFYNIEESFV